MIPCTACKGEFGIENVELMRKGMRTTCPQLYSLPSKAASLHQSFVDSMKAKRWNFILVSGDNGDGKSVYIKFLEHIADELGYPIVHIEIKDDQIAEYGPGPYFTLEIFNKLRLPDGELLSWKIRNDDRIRKKIHGILQKDMASFEFWSSALTAALMHLTENAESELGKMAMSWLKGEPKYLTELRDIGILDKTMKSVLNVPTDRALYFLKELLNHLGHPGLIVSVDEIERVADLNRPKSIPTLSVLRDIINILTSHDSMPAKRGITNGLFVVYGISTFFLGYSGILERSGVDFAAQADKYGRPKVTLMDVPRLGTVLKDSAAQIDISFDSLQDLEHLAERVIPCYSHAMRKTSVSVVSKDLAKASFDRTNKFSARANIMAMVKVLDKS